MKKQFEIPIHFTGSAIIVVDAETEVEAMEKASSIAEDIDCGQLSDIDWTVGPSISAPEQCSM